MNTPEIKQRPDIVIVEPTTFCTNSCRDCPSGAGLVLGQDLEWLFFERFLDDIRNDPPPVVRFAGYGEPPAWPHIVEAILELRAVGVKTIGLVTTGQAFVPGRLQELFEAGLNELELSMGLLNSDEYYQVVGASREWAERSLREALEHKPEGVLVNISIIGRSGAKEARRHYENMPGVDRVFIRQHAKLVDEQLVVDCDEERWPCPQLWQRLTLSADGSWRYCCSDWESLTYAGHGPLADAWVSPIMQEYRRAHLEGRFSDVPACGNCGIWCMSRWDEHSYAANIKEERCTTP